MAMTNNISETLEQELLHWPGVTVGTHRFGGREFRVGKREIGHLHGDRVADLPFPRAVREELVSRREVSLHHHLPKSGWISFYIRDENDIPALLALFRRNYERLYALAQRGQEDNRDSAINSDPHSVNQESP